MATTKQQIYDHVASELHELLEETGLLDSGGVEQAIESALDLLAVDDDDREGPFTSPSRQALYTVAEYTVLRRIHRAFAVRVDIDVDGPAVSKKRSQLFEQTGKLLAEAKAEAFKWVESEEQDDWQVGFMNLDLLTPAPQGVYTNDGIY